MSLRASRLRRVTAGNAERRADTITLPSHGRQAAATPMSGGGLVMAEHIERDSSMRSGQDAAAPEHSLLTHLRVLQWATSIAGMYSRLVATRVL